jgi:hypothetical protein
MQNENRPNILETNKKILKSCCGAVKFFNYSILKVVVNEK